MECDMTSPLHRASNNFHNFLTAYSMQVRSKKTLFLLPYYLALAALLTSRMCDALGCATSSYRSEPTQNESPVGLPFKASMYCTLSFLRLQSHLASNAPYTNWSEWMIFLSDGSVYVYLTAWSHCRQNGSKYWLLHDFLSPHHTTA